MKNKIKIAPLCRGAKTIVNITFPLILLEIVYIIFYIRSTGAAGALAQSDAVFTMLEDTLTSAMASLGGALFFDYYFKRETRED